MAPRAVRKTISSYRRGDLVEAVAVPEGITLPQPQPGERGVVFEEQDAYGDGGGPMVRFANGGVCNVYEGWVKRVP